MAVSICINGVAVKCFIGVSLGAIVGVLTMLLPWPFRFASWQIKSSAEAASKDTAKLFLLAIDYFSGEKGNVYIEQQLAWMANLRTKLDGMGGPIGAAWQEGFDAGKSGKVRFFIQKH